MNSLVTDGERQLALTDSASHSHSHSTRLGSFEGVAADDTDTGCIGGGSCSGSGSGSGSGGSVGAMDAYLLGVLRELNDGVTMLALRAKQVLTQY